MRSRKTVIAKCDRLFSYLIRQNQKSPVGLQRCVTCGVVKHWKELQCGHYRSRRFMATRWNAMNAGPQCKQCNKWGHPRLQSVSGEPKAMREYLVDRFGEKKVAVHVEQGSRQQWTPRLFELEQIEAQLKERLREQGHDLPK